MDLERLRSRLDALNEVIYEPEEPMLPSQRDRLMAERDRVYEQIQELELAESGE